MKKLLLMMTVVLSMGMMMACTTQNENNVDVPSNENEQIESEESNESNESNETTETPTDENESEESLPDDLILEHEALDVLIDKIYEATALELPLTMKTPVDGDNMTYMLGVDNFEYLEGLASEPMMSSIAHSLVMVVVDEFADIEAIKADIKSNVDGRKWICVGVEEENIRVENIGNIILLVMDHDSQVYVDAFNTVMEK